MVKKLSDIRKYWDNITTWSTSRFGIFFALLSVSAIFYAIGAVKTMNIWIVLGLTFTVLAIIFGLYCLIKGSKDPTATKDDIKGLSKEIRELRKVMREGIIARGKRGRWH